VLAQYATNNGAELDRALRMLLGQVLGFVLVIVFALWLMRRGRANRANRPPASGWYPDPFGAPHERWWNGANWTGHIRAVPWPGPSASAPPLGPTGPWVPPPQPPGQSQSQSSGPWSGA